MTIVLAARRIRTIVLCCLTGLCITGPAFAQNSNDKVHVDIPAQSLSSALTQFGRDTGTEIVFTPDAVNQKVSTAIKGDFARDKAIALMLAGTGLTYHLTAQGAIVINGSPAPDKRKEQTSVAGATEAATRVAQSAAGGRETLPTSDESGDVDQKSKKNTGLDEIVVTGSHIRGVSAESEPLTIYDRAAIEQTGSVTIAEFASTMTENLNSVNTLTGNIGLPVPGGSQSGGAIGNQSGFNLHGLGPGQTLTLLDGIRLTAGGGGAEPQFFDASLIPTAAIKRVEVLTDGASAIYGSDAVAGVVNIILRDDFTGADTSVQYSAPTRSGGGDHLTATQLLGESWSSGHAMLVYQLNRQGSLAVYDRDFVPQPPIGQLDLSPYAETNSVIFTVAQWLNDSTKLSSDLLYGGMTTRNHLAQDYYLPVIQSDQSAVSNQYAATISLDHEFSHDWHGDLVAAYSKSLQNYGTYLFFPANPSVNRTSPSAPDDNSLSNAHVDVSGPIATLPGGQVKVAFGGEYRRETIIDGGSGLTEAPFLLARHIESGFAELLIPIVGEGNSFFGIQRLQMSVAARYDDYSDVGSTTNPHIGVLWTPLQGVNLRGTYSRAFKAPDLDQTGFSIQQADAQYVPNPASLTGQTAIIENSPSGNPSLRPQTSRTYTFGFDVRPPDLDRLDVSATYFHTVFENVVGNPPCTVADCPFQPYNAPFLNTSPSQQQIQALFALPLFYNAGNFTPADIQAIFNAGLTNLSRYTQSGVDLSASYSLALGIGSLKLGESASYLIDNSYLIVAGVPAISVLNGVGEPLKFRARSSVGWSAGGFSSLVTADYRNSYKNEFQTPPQNVADWVTVDLHLTYEFNTGDWWLTRGTRLALHVTNLFDRNPPPVVLPNSVSTVNIGFDSVNANPFGRVIAVSIEKKW